MGFDLILPFLRPIEPLLLDDEISEIMGNPDSTWCFEREDSLEQADICFPSEGLRTGLEVVANKLGKKLNEDSPTLHARHPDGSPLVAVIRRVVRPGLAWIICKSSSRKFTVEDLINCSTLTREMAEYLLEQVEVGKTILIRGGTGTGKTTLLNILARSIPNDQRIVTAVPSQRSLISYLSQIRA